MKQAIAADQDQSFEATDESFEYKNHIDSTGKCFTKITGQVYALGNQPSSFNLEYVKSFETSGADELFMAPSGKFARRNNVSKVETFTHDDGDNPIGFQAEIRTANLIAPTTQFQPTQANANSYASTGEQNSHEAMFKSLFKAEWTKNDAGTVLQSLTEENADTGSGPGGPKLLLKRKAAWSGIVGNRGSDVANLIQEDGNQNEFAAEVGAHSQQTQVVHMNLVRRQHMNSVRRQFQHQRFVCSVHAASTRALTRTFAGSSTEIYLNLLNEYVAVSL
jgi:hypothetical protein